MAGISNQPNLKPLIDNQTLVQSLDFTRLKNSAFYNKTVIEETKESVSLIGNNLGITHSEVRNSKEAILAEFDSIRALLSSEIDSNGDLTVANLTSFKNAIIDEVQNSQSALNFTVSSSGDAVLEMLNSKTGAIIWKVTDESELVKAHVSAVGVENLDLTKTAINSARNFVSDNVTGSKASILAAVESAETAVINSIDAAKTDTLSGVSGYVTAAKTAVIDSVDAAKSATLSGVSGYVTAAKTAVLDAISALSAVISQKIVDTCDYYYIALKERLVTMEQRLNARIDNSSSSVKSVQRGVVTIESALLTNVSISSVNLAKSTLIISERGGAGGFLSAANQIRFEKSPTATNYQDGDSAVIYWQVVEYV